MVKPELIFYNGLKLHEALFRDKKSKQLLFVAIRDNKIFSLNPETKYVKTYETDGAVGGAVTDKDGNIIECEKLGVYKIDAQTGQKTFIINVLPYETMRYNHLMLDSRGRIFLDVMGDEEKHEESCGLYQVDGNNVRCLVKNTKVANGIVLTADEKKIYFADSEAKKVYEYDYDIETGNISNEKIFVEFEHDYEGLPDGVMLGRKNDLWIAEWNSGVLSRYNLSDGKKISEIKFPAAHVTSTCIGGENDKYMFISTAKRTPCDDAPSGGIFRLNLDEIE